VIRSLSLTEQEPAVTALRKSIPPDVVVDGILHRLPAEMGLLVWPTAMALIKCKECGGQLSSDAKICQYCGYDTPSAAKEAVGGVVAFGCMGIIALFLLLVLIAALTGTR